MRRPVLSSRAVSCWLGMLCVSLLASSQVASAQASDRGLGRQSGDRPDSLAVVPVEVAPAVKASAVADGNAEALARFEAVLNDRLATALSGTRKFTMVARSRLDSVLEEQAFAASGFVDVSDPGAARSMKIAGVRWLAVPRVVDFEDLVRTRRFEGLDRVVSRRTIRAAVTVEVLDSTTGVVGETATLTLESTDTADENARAKPRGGDPTGGLVESLSTEFADGLACQLVDVAYPATVLAVNGSTVTINRGAGGCLQEGQRWIVSVRGASLVDPDTGEVLGHDERDTGVIEITRIEPKLSRARTLTGSVPAGGVLRSVPKGWSLADFRPADSASDAVDVVTAPSGVAAGNGSLESGSAGGSLADLGPVAVVVLEGDSSISADVIAATRAAILGSLSGTGLRVVDPQEVATAAGAGIDDDASLVRLAEAVGANWLLVATVADAGGEQADVEMNGRSFRRIGERIAGSWRLMAASDAAAIAGGTFDEVGSSLQAPSSNGISTSVKTGLRQEAAGNVGRRLADSLRGDAARIAARRGEARPAEENGWVQVDVVLDGLVVPEVTKDEEGRWIVRSSSLPVMAGGAEVALDGFVLGSTPCLIDAKPGPHRLTLTRQGLESWSRSIRVLGRAKAEPQVIRAGLQLDAATRERYLANAAVFEGLKEGAALTAAQVEALEGFAAYLRQSGYRIDRRSDDSIRIDSDQVPEVMQRNSFWSRW